jgi:hypothetical protein
MTTAARRIAMTPRNVARVGAIVCLTLVGSSALGGTAYAFWIAAGTGTGAAQAGVAQPLTTTAVAASSTLLYPEGPVGDVTLRINNPNPFPITVTDVTATGTITSDKGAACDGATGVTFTDQTGLTLAVPASSSQSFTLTGAVSMDNSSDNTCQGALFTIGVSLAGGSG